MKSEIFSYSLEWELHKLRTVRLKLVICLGGERGQQREAQV